MTDKKVKEAGDLIASAKNIVIVPHKGPDGDAIGSSLGLYHFLKKKNNKNVKVISPNDYPDFLKWLPATEEILIFEQQEETCRKIIADADLIFTLDFNGLKRSGDMKTVLEEAGHADFIMIDHHPMPDSYARVTFSDTSMSSTCQMIYTFIKELNGLAEINKDIATCLYAGIMTDTGSFRFKSTTSDTHRAIADLIDKGADGASIHQKIYDTSTENRIQLLGVALQNLRVNHELKTAYITLTQKELDAHGFQKGDTEGFVNYGLTLEGIIFAAIFIEHKAEGIIKISFRSKGDFSVNEFARAHFEGGGHENAAGGKSHLSMSKTIEKFNKLLLEYKEDLK